MSQKLTIFPYIERLLQGTEVVWKPLGEVAEYEQPTKYLVKSSNYKDIYPTPVLTAGKTFILGYTDETEGIYKASISPVIIFDDFTTANKWVDFDFKAKSSAMKMITSKNEKELLLKYIYYWLNTLPSELIEGDHKRQWISNYANKKIPLPPLSVQQEIVRILDKFTQLEAELEAELEGRKRQYKYYRNKLLSYEGNEVEWKTLGEVGEVTKLAGFEFTNYVKYNDTGKIIALRGLNVKGSLDLSDVKYIDESDFSKLNRSKLYINDMLFTYVGTVGSVALIPENDKYYLAPNVARIRFLDRKINPRFMFHYFQSDEFKKKQINRYLGSSSMKNLTMENIRKFQIPLPSLSRQQRIASILDKFDTLVNSISEGLPKEIALRRKQYEYYREKLLSFPKQ